MNFSKETCWIDPKIRLDSTETATPHSWYSHVVTVAGDYFNICNALELHIFKSLKVTFSNSVVKHCFVAVSVKLQLSLRFKTFYWFLKLLYCFCFKDHNQHSLFCSTFLDILAISAQRIDSNWISKIVYSVSCCHKNNFFWSLLFLNKSQRRGIPKRLVDKCSHSFICIFSYIFMKNCQKVFYFINNT